MSTETITPLLLGAEALAAALNVSRAQVFNMDASGALGPMPVKLGRRTLWVSDEVRRWVLARCPKRDEWMELEKMSH